MDDATSLDAALAAARAEQAWGYRALFEGLGGAVTGYVRARGASDPEDLTNAVFLRAFRALHTFDGDAARFRTWLFTIAHHAAVDERRRRARRVTETALDGRGPEPASGADLVADEVLSRLARERVEGLFEALSADQRDVLVLRIVADLTVEQTAAVLGKSYEAVKALQRRGLGALKRAHFADEAVPR